MAKKPHEEICRRSQWKQMPHLMAHGGQLVPLLGRGRSLAPWTCPSPGLPAGVA